MNLFIVSIKLLIIRNYVLALYVLPVIVLLCAIFLYLFRWRDYLLPLAIVKRKSESNRKDTVLPRLSVIIPANEQAVALAENLPKILEQDYPDFEVIVVDEASTDETEDVIKQLQLKYRNLRRTFVPSTADICRRKLSITLGVRASRSEWAVITSASASPVSNLWLKRIAEEIDEQTDVILGYGSFIDNGSHYSKRAIFERLWMQIRCYRAAENGPAVGGDEINFCIRKSTFLAHRGYAENLQNDFGESHLLIQKLSQRDNTKVVISPDATMTEILPNELIWKNMQIYYRETLKQSSHRMRAFLVREGFCSLLVYLTIFCVLLYISLRGVQLLYLHDYSLRFVYCDVFMFILIASISTLPILMFRRCTNLFKEPKLDWVLVNYALSRPFRNILLKYHRWVLRKDLVRG